MRSNPHWLLFAKENYVVEGSDRDYIQANVNGRLQDAREVGISPLDRSFLYGDALYEVWRTYDGTLFAWREHWERLESTALGLGLALPLSQKEALHELRRAARAWEGNCGPSESLYIRLQISRGAGPIGLDTSLADEACFVVYVKALEDPGSAAWDRGASLIVSRRWRRNSVEALPPALKTGNYLNNIQGLREAREAGADDVLFLNAAGRLTEASTRNIWLVFPDRIATPPLSDGLLSGVTRRILLERIRALDGRPLVEEPLGPEDIEQAVECFLSSTTQDVQPVRQVDGWRFPTGAATATRRLKEVFRAYVADYAKEHAELRLRVR